ncbi:hypothetical protein MOQ_000690 [Trypanosoma cruzi marinkellei]|uniref:ODAD1 central coiled coil region domain-containing protein n=1 Tax=Trypanosoma cruzi marinkellei TaxID=85056 RepID=K2NVU0_TRYCR|nr:hypothetical protein MOQ_000690 [Trypanosoma cruzi marinkellei]
MEEAGGGKPTGTSATKRNDATLPIPRGAGITLVESLRRRQVQAELQLRETEDRFRRDCARQEQELDLLRIENSKYKAKIEEMRMAQTAPRETMMYTFGHGRESNLLRASSHKYCMAREAVEKARETLSEIKARVVALRQRIHDMQRQCGNARSRVDYSSRQSRRSCIEIELQTRASRLQLRGLEAHVEFETDRLSGIIEEVKALRRDIDVLLTAQRRSAEIFQDRENEMLEIMKETSFLIEVCNLLSEERDAYRQQLLEIQRASETDHEAYENAFSDLVGVEERDKVVKAKLREGVAKLEDELRNVTREREAAERLVREEEAASRANRRGENGNDNDSELENNDLSRQVAEFERYIARLADMAGSESLPDIERYICEGGEERFQLYSVLHRTQDDLAALEQEKEALQEARWIATEGSEVEHRAREELEELQAKLRQIQSDTLDHEQQAECVRAQIDASLPDVQSIFDALGCDDSLIVAQHGMSVLSRGTVKLFFASIEQRLEEYMAAWMQRQHPSQVASPTVVYNTSGFGITAQPDTSKTITAASLHVLPSTNEPETVGHEKGVAGELLHSDWAQVLVKGHVENGGIDVNDAGGTLDIKLSV